MAARSTKLNPVRGEFEFEINGKKVKGHSSINALRMFCVSKGKKFDELQEIMEADEFGSIAEIIYYSCVNYSHRNEEDFDMTKDKFISFALDDFEETSKAAAVVMQSLKVAKESQSDEPKK
jgi:hypothetical protein